MTIRILIGDCRQRLAELPGESVHCVVSSPPYFRQRDYGVDGQIGQEETPTDLAEALADVFAEAHRALRPDGCLWLLGDFPSVEYVAFWKDMLTEHDRLTCFGYTHRLSTAWDGDEIGDAIQALKDVYPDRFRIRWSSAIRRPDSAMVIDYVPRQPQIEEGIVCPAQTDATACCASCALCWDLHNKSSIVFIKHGQKSEEAAAKSAAEVRVETLSAEVDALSQLPALQALPKQENVRPITAQVIAGKRDRPLSEMPEMRLVAPTDLKVEPSYQRDLSGKSIKLIRKIVIGWDWAKFKPPVCAETPDGLLVIDGQHTAIAAATHPEIRQIPVMVVKAAQIEQRADAFVAHNRDRLTMTAAQIFYGDVAAKRKDALAVLDAVVKAGGSIPRLFVQRGYAKPGQITAVKSLREIQNANGPAVVERVVRIAVLARVAPVSLAIVAGLRAVVIERAFADVGEMKDEQIAAALASIKNIEAVAQHYGAETGQSRFRACASLIAKAAREAEKVAA